MDLRERFKQRLQKVKEHQDNMVPQHRPSLTPITKVISTGSTLVDLAISGGRIPSGGLPTGIMVEIFGPSGWGKTALSVEIGSRVQAMGGVADYYDPEGRLDKEYARLFGLRLSPEHYHRPETVLDFFHNNVWNWDELHPDNDQLVCKICDSSTSLNPTWDSDQDARGQRRAKEINEGCRRSALKIARPNRLLLFTSQVRENTNVRIPGQSTEVVPGGKGIPFYSSLRIRVGPSGMGSKVKKKIKFGRKDMEKVIGICSEVKIEKSSIDDPFRKAFFYFIFGYGIDDIRANLVWLKDIAGATSYSGLIDGVDSRLGVGLEDAIKVVERESLEPPLKSTVQKKWRELQEAFQTERKPRH